MPPPLSQKVVLSQATKEQLVSLRSNSATTAPPRSVTPVNQLTYCKAQCWSSPSCRRRVSRVSCVMLGIEGANEDGIAGGVIYESEGDDADPNQGRNCLQEAANYVTGHNLIQSSMRLCN